LWWVCVYERNRLATEEYERRRLKAGYGESESDERNDTVRLTMRAIKHTLTERWYAWQNGRKYAEEQGVVFDSNSSLEYKSDEEVDAEWEKMQDSWEEQQIGGQSDDMGIKTIDSPLATDVVDGEKSKPVTVQSAETLR